MDQHLQRWRRGGRDFKQNYRRCILNRIIITLEWPGGRGILKFFPFLWIFLQSFEGRQKGVLKTVCMVYPLFCEEVCLYGFVNNLDLPRQIPV